MDRQLFFFAKNDIKTAVYAMRINDKQRYDRIKSK